MSRRAVSVEHLASLAYLDVVRNPLNPLTRQLITRRWRSFTWRRLIRSQSLAFLRTPASAFVRGIEGAVQTAQEPFEP